MANIYDVGDYLGITNPGTLTRGLKLAYYAQAWHLAWHGTPLFDEPVEAWKNGPVVPHLWAYAKGRPRTSAPGTLTATERATLDAVIAHYGALSGSQLSEMTHREAPWVDARGALGTEESSNVEIPRNRMCLWCVEQSLEGRGPVYRGPQAPAPSYAELEASGRRVAREDAEIFRELAAR